nr:MMPL family transporter [Arsenicicoccus piscis]
MLYHLGRFSARRPWTVVIAWIVLLGVVTGAAVGLHKPLTSEMTVEGAPFQVTLQKLQRELPAAAGGNGTVVLRSDDGTFTAAQKAAVAKAVTQWEAQPAVASVRDPFVLQQQLDDAQRKIADGEQQIATNAQKLADGQKQLDAGTVQLDANAAKLAQGKGQIATAFRQISAGESQLAAGKQRVAQGQSELASGRRQLAAGRSELAAGKAKLASGQAQIASGERQLAAGQATLDSGKAQLAAAQQELDSGKAQLADARAKARDGDQQLAAQQHQLDAAKTQLAGAEQQLAADQARLPEAERELAAQQARATSSPTSAPTPTAPAPTGSATPSATDTATPATQPTTAADPDPAVQAKIAALRSEIARLRTEIPTLRATVDQQTPAIQTAQRQLDQGKGKAAAGKATIDTKAAELAAGQQKLDAKKAELAAGQRTLDAKAQQLQGGKAQLAAAAAKVDNGQRRVDAAAAKLAAGERAMASAQATIDTNEAKLDDARAKAQAGQLKLTEGEKQLLAARDEVTKRQQQITDGRAQLDKARADLALGKRQAALTDGLRFVSTDGTTALVGVTFDKPMNSVAPEDRKEVTTLTSELKDAGITALYGKELTEDVSSVAGPGEIVGLIVAAIVLIITLGTLVAAGLPLLMALGGVGLGLGVTMALTHVLTLNTVTPVLALMIGLAVGIDYALFIVNRHRTQLRRGMGVVDSLALAIGTAGNAVTFAGLTVFIALAALTVTGIGFLAAMGLVAAGTVLAAVLINLTLLPALLSLVGLRVLRKKERAALAEHAATGAVTTGGRHIGAEGDRGWGAWVTRRPWPVILGGLVLVGLLGFPAAGLRLGLPDGGSESPSSSAYQAYTTIGDKFGAGANGPIIAVADLPAGLTAQQATLKQVEVAERLATVEGVDRVVPAGISPDRTTAVLQAIPTTGPADETTTRTVEQIRADAPAIAKSTGAEVEITGQTVANIDISAKLADALPPYLAIVVGLSLVLLLLVFRSVVVPLVATAGFLISLVVAFGGVVAVYQHGFLGGLFGVAHPGPILSFLPILLIGVLFGLAMDYQMFLVSGMREAHVHGEDARRAVRLGFSHAAAVVTAAAIIMISVFSGFIHAELTMIRPIGFGLALGVLTDAFLVRMTLTPALMHLLGEKAWWIPRWLDRILPDVDVEGLKLVDRVEHPR